MCLRKNVEKIALVATRLGFINQPLFSFSCLIALAWTINTRFICFLFQIFPPDVKNWLLGKDPDAGKEWKKEEKGMTEDEMIGWHHRLDGHEFEQAPGVGDGQGSLTCCSPWGSQSHKWLSDWTELNPSLLPWVLLGYFFLSLWDIILSYMS